MTPVNNLAHTISEYETYVRTIECMNKNKGMHTHEQMMEKKRLESQIRNAQRVHSRTLSEKNETAVESQ